MRAKKNPAVLVKGYGPPLASEPMRDYENDPFVLEKLEKAKAFLEKHPIPEHLLKK